METLLSNDHSKPYFCISMEVFDLQHEMFDVDVAEVIRSNLSSDQICLFDSANERGASVWLSALPLKEHSFDLRKGAFRDAVVTV